MRALVQSSAAVRSLPSPAQRLSAVAALGLWRRADLHRRTPLVPVVQAADLRLSHDDRSSVAPTPNWKETAPSLVPSGAWPMRVRLQWRPRSDARHRGRDRSRLARTQSEEAPYRGHRATHGRVVVAPRNALGAYEKGIVEASGLDRQGTSASTRCSTSTQTRPRRRVSSRPGFASIS